MPITHTTVKIAGNKLFAVSDWNADHTTPTLQEVYNSEAGSDRIILTERNGYPPSDFIIKVATGDDFILRDEGNSQDVLSIRGGVIPTPALSSVTWLPYTTDTWDLGSDALRWKDLYLSGFIEVAGYIYTGYELYVDGDAYFVSNIYCDGNVGIGLYDPGEKLSVAGNVMIGDSAWSGGTTTGNLAVQGNVGIGTATPAVSAILDLTSTTGALLVPRMTTAEKAALTAINGMIVYDTTLNKFQGYENGAWTSFI